jgi:hypothetical protein
MDAALERTAALLACVPGGLLPARTLAALTGWSARRLSRVCAAVDAAGGACVRLAADVRNGADDGDPA